MNRERKIREEIVRVGKSVHQCGFVAATDGNISVRLDGKRVLVTPTAMSKGAMRTDDLVIVDMEGRKLKGRRNVSTEIGMHMLVYRLRPDVNAVVHAHPPTATGYAAAGMPLPEALCSEVVIALGSIPLARYGTPGTPELAAALSPLIPGHDAILMANHGVVSYGEDLAKAYMKMETVEHFAQIALVTHLLGKQQLLSQEEIGKLMIAREKYEATSSNHRGPKPAEPAGVSKASGARSGR